MPNPNTTNDTGAADDVIDENRPLTAREIAMNAIKPHRDDDMDQGDDDQTQQQIEVQTQAEPEPQVLSDGLDKVRVKIKIDGVESEVTVEEMTRQFQKNSAADKRLAEATRLLQEAQARAAAVPTPPVGIANTPGNEDITPTPSATGAEEGKEFLAALFDGDEDRALQALDKVLGGRRSSTPNESELVAKLTPQIKQQLIVESALEQFKVDFADVVSDPYLASLADDFLEQETQGGKPFAEALQAAGKRTRDWLSSKVPATPTPNTPTMDRTTKLERKAAMDNIPALSKTATTTQAPPQTPSDIIAEMRKARGME